MSQIYAVELNYNMTEDEFESLLTKLSQEKQKKIQRYVFRQDAIRSLTADLLVRRIVMNEYQIANDRIQYKMNEYGKPAVKGLPSFHFNVSHSGDWVVCATDNQAVGIDIEQIRSIDFQIAERFFSKAEVQDLEKKTGEAKLAYFYDLWSLKESYIKMAGKGLSIPLDSFSCKYIGSQFLFESHSESHSGQHSPVFFKQYDLDPQYKLAVCQGHSDFPKDVHRISLEAIVRREHTD